MSSVRTWLTPKWKGVFLPMLPRAESGHEDPKINYIWIPLTSTLFGFRVRKEKLFQTCCEKPMRMGRWENVKLSLLILTALVLPAFVISYCISSMVLHTCNLCRMQYLRTDCFEHTMTRMNNVGKKNEVTISRKCFNDCLA